MSLAKQQPFFSIIIPTLNEAKYLPKLLGDLKKQSFQNFEVIHIDGHSEDQTVVKAQSFAKKLTIKTTQIDVRNVSVQRNYGAKLAKGEWLLFFDADDRLPTYFLDGLRYQIARQPNVDLFTTWVNIEGDGQIFRAIEQMVNITFEVYNQLDRPFAPGAMIGIRSKYRDQNEFDQTQKVLEDYYFIKTAVDSGLSFKIFREPRYIFSLRRYRKQALKTIGAGAILHLKYLSGQDISKSDYGYTMEGGAAYDTDKSPSMLSNLSTFMQRASQKQLAEAKRILSSLMQDL